MSNCQSCDCFIVRLNALLLTSLSINVIVFTISFENLLERLLSNFFFTASINLKLMTKNNADCHNIC